MSEFLLFDFYPDAQAPTFNWESHNALFKTKNVVFWAKSCAAEFPEHWGCFSIKTVLSGTEYFFLEGEKFALTPHKYLILNDGQHYGSQVASEEQVESFTINFSETYLAEAMQALLADDAPLLDDPTNIGHYKLEFLQHFHEHDAIITPILQQIYTLSQHFKQNEMRIEDAYFNVLKALLQKESAVQQVIAKTPGAKQSTKTELFRRLSRGKDFIDSNFNQSIALDDMAQVSYLSKYHFLESFKQVFHLTPYQYLTKVRLEQARNMLKNQDISVQEVCQSVGYEDISSFSKLYKKTFGILPSKVS